jgi:DNA repair exonuclease SbcCD nuclease subunit
LYILAVGDVQICPKSYVAIDSILTQFVTKILEIRDKYQERIVVVFPGDIFEYNNYSNSYVPPSMVIEPIAKFLRVMEENQVNVVMVAGNHDKTYGDFSNATDIFKGNSIYNISDEIKEIELDGVSFIMVPWLLNHQYSNRKEVVDKIRTLAKEAKEKSNLPILVGHLRVLGSEEKQYKVKNSNYSFVFSKEELNSTGIEYGILGDIHKHQNVVKKIDYIGGIRQRHFGESENPSLVRHLHITNLNGNWSVTDNYEEIIGISKYIVIQIESEEKLMEILKQEFDPIHQYRLEMNFETQIRSPFLNVHFRCTKPSAIKKQKTTQIIGSKLTHTAMIKLYNDVVQELSASELQDVINFFQENHP